MKILFIIPGSGDSFYCGNCFRDNLQASALRKAGHDVIIMPLYLPLKHKSFQADTPLFFSAVSYYVSQRFFRGKRMPGWLMRLTGSSPMLTIASSMSGTTSAEGMEEMTLSMITGNDPAFSNSVSELIDWISGNDKPDIIHLSSTLLVGIAKEIKRRLTIPIVCSAQDEEVWIDSLKKKQATDAWQGIKENLQYVDRLLTTSNYYKEVLKKRLSVDEKIEVIYPGIDKEKYTSTDYPTHPVIGFFYRMNAGNGLGLLVDAFIKLKKKNSIDGLKLKIGGGYTRADKQYMRKIKRKLAPYKEDVEINESYSLDNHADFYSSVSVISVPITFDEGVGVYLCESFAAGRPAVEPATGSFPEIVGEAGVLYEPNNHSALANALEHILTDKVRYEQLASKAKNLSATRYNQQVMVKKLCEVYQQQIIETNGL